jgi:hypothetical protein
MELAKIKGGSVRPARTLISLINDALEQGDKAAAAAAMPFYRTAGLLMLEAKTQMPHGEFTSWLNRNIKRSKSQCSHYMELARATADGQKLTANDFSSLKDFRRRHLGHDVPTTGGSMRKPSWQEPVKDAIGKVNLDALKQDALARQEERALQRKLALSLIDIGYKALASKLHPDKGGSREAMARLNRVRDILRDAVSS